MSYSLYYQAHATKELCWMVTSALRFTEHIVFDRAYDKDQSIFEFFVSPEGEDVFLDVMYKLEKEGILFNIQKLPNRLEILDSSMNLKQ